MSDTDAYVCESGVRNVRFSENFVKCSIDDPYDIKGGRIQKTSSLILMFSNMKNNKQNHQMGPPEQLTCMASFSR